MLDKLFRIPKAIEMVTWNKNFNSVIQKGSLPSMSIVAIVTLTYLPGRTDILHVQ